MFYCCNFLIQNVFPPSDDHDVLSFLLFRLTEPGQQPVTTFSLYFPFPNTFPVFCAVYFSVAVCLCVRMHACAQYSLTMASIEFRVGFSFLFFLSFPLKPPPESEIPKEEKDKYQEEFQNFQQELDKKKEEFQKEHPDVQGEPS